MKYMSTLEKGLATRIEDLLEIIDRTDYTELDEIKAYYLYVKKHTRIICKDLILVNNIHDSITNNRNIILDVIAGTRNKEALKWRLYTWDIKL